MRIHRLRPRFSPPATIPGVIRCEDGRATKHLPPAELSFTVLKYSGLLSGCSERDRECLTYQRATKS